MARSQSLLLKFEDGYTPVPESGCWLWTKTTDRYGYGVMPRTGTSRRAHRVAWELLRGPIPKGLCVCHRCDVTSCVNPAHLFLGTQADNVRDCVRKRRARGPAPRAVCGHGHPRTPENTKTRRNGRRVCRPCIRLFKVNKRQRERLARKKGN